MATYRETINQIGNTIAEYNARVWSLFKEQMVSEVNSQFDFLIGKKSDESLLNYSLPYIEDYNNRVRGKTRTENDPKFTYFTSKNGPEFTLEGKPVLADPSSKLNIKEDYNVNVGDIQYNKIEYNGALLGEYAERGKFNESKFEKDYHTLDDVDYLPFMITNGKKNTLLSKTENWFRDGQNDYIAKRYATLISRFHTDNDQISNDEISKSVGLQAGTEYGLSHGNNLLKKNHKESETNGYSDPYCRVWTWHKQYSRFVRDTIRPFSGTTVEDWKSFRSYNEDAGTYFQIGGKRLSEYGAMYDNEGKTYGLVNITPSYSETSEAVNIKNCMFSIENLAWKGKFSSLGGEIEQYGLSPEQKGPLGGRIMWFPPYDLKFSEDTNANWQSNEFIGRGEPIYTYANTTRSGNLSFKLLIDHPAILDYWDGRNKPVEDNGNDVDSKEQELLRFFAGCDILKANGDGEINQDVNKQDDYNDNDNNAEENQTDSNGNKKMVFLVFFPNNYSGVDDVNSVFVNPIDYLINGVGAQKYTTNHENDNITFDDINDLQVEKNASYYYNGNQIGGYEIGDFGISIINSATTNNAICVISGSTGEIRLAKMFNKDKVPVKETKPKSDNILDIEQWNLCRYYYRCDNSELDDKFVATDDNGAASYIDKRSYQLNKTIVGNNHITGFLKSHELDVKNTYSLAEVYASVVGKVKNIENVDGGRVDEIKSILRGDYGDIQEITVKGWASAQGNNESDEVNEKQNDTLATNRANTVAKWIANNIKGIDTKKIKTSSKWDKDGVSYKSKESSDLGAKLNRFALVEIIYGNAEITDATETSVTQPNTVILNQVDPNSNNELTNYEEEIGGEAIVNFNRYDCEAKFFQQLTDKDPFITKQISDRIKNFDPVFHSMSPEGFNARLTFLNQCMRQGPTISWSDNRNGYNANNMAFGRPPVCVLRVGDFYNTKIIINSLNITYDPLVWDLNHEGIGVMPMIANVTIGFNFIGGSELGGPIERLQNATSFNYYANTSVYDNRSEMINRENLNNVYFKASPM